MTRLVVESPLTRGNSHRYDRDDDIQNELTHWYAEMDYIIHQIGEDTAHGQVEAHQFEALRDVLKTLEDVADEVEE